MKLFFLFFLVISLQAKKPELLLLNNYKNDINTTSWYMSEKLDGIRAFWNGKELISRSGKIFSVPKFFIKNFPKHELDGELWSQRNDFSNIVSIVNRKKADQRWNQVTYNIFEVPSAKGNLLERLKKVKETQYIKIIKQVEVKSKKHLNQFLKTIEDKGGEGIVVRDGNIKYYTGRTNNSLKVKSYSDKECIVIGYNKGKGKYEGLLGSLSCVMKTKKVIKIGSGFTKEQRVSPPVIGAIVTFKHYGLTSLGNPRFPIFLRIREQ
ncbi:DNA ligase [Sulfurimonas sp.]|nr:DNA ligase [Sulfurimonas sp.]